MPFVLFGEYFPEIADNETRSVFLQESSSFRVPAGEYAFLEMFCDERGCDCRRVFFYVVTTQKKRPLAVIAYGWETRKFYAKWMRSSNPETIKQLQGPVLNISSPQSNLAPVLLRIFKEVLLPDKLYIERIKKHYRIFRDRIEKRPVLPRRRGKIKRK